MTESGANQNTASGARESQTITPNYLSLRLDFVRGAKPATGKKPSSTPNPLCQCGCGREVYLPWNKYINTHQWRDYLHPRQVGRIRKLLGLGVWVSECAKIFRCSERTIYEIRRGEWKRFNKWAVPYVEPVRIEQILEERKPIEEMKQWRIGKQEMAKVKEWLRQNSPQCR